MLSNTTTLLTIVATMVYVIYGSTCEWNDALRKVLHSIPAIVMWIVWVQRDGDGSGEQHHTNQQLHTSISSM